MKKIAIVLCVLVLAALIALLAYDRTRQPQPEEPRATQVPAGKSNASPEPEASAEITTEPTPVPHAHDDLAAFPESIRAQIPEEYGVIHEIITAQLDGDPSNVKAMNVTFRFDTQYPPDEEVYLLYGYKKNGRTVWIGGQGKTTESGSVQAKLGKKHLERLAGHQFAVAVVSKKK